MTPNGTEGFQDGYVQTDGVRLHYVDWGNHQRQTVVLLHGLQDCARSWDVLAASLSPDYHVIALDHRGHGCSDQAPKDRYRLKDYVADVEAIVDQLGLGRVVLAGHSAGGRNAFVYAAGHPDRVEALAVVDIDPDSINAASREMFKRYLAEDDEWPSLEAVVERLRQRQPNSNREMLEHQALHMTKALPHGGRAWKRDPELLTVYKRPDLWAEWSSVGCPTLIVRGRQSELLTHPVAVRMRETIPRSRLAELEGGGHWVYQEVPGAFEATLRWFLQALPQ